MTKNTVKAGLTANRASKRSKSTKQVVENDQFDAFVRRILAAYARRVAAGDVEALASLAALSSEVDAVVRLAVAGLRKSPYRYSWSEIADRLGTSRQAAQMRYGESTTRTDRVNGGGLDRRLLDAGLSVTVATLAEVFADHHPGEPVASVCPGCGYRYPDQGSACPTLATVRPLLYRRRNEDRPTLTRILSRVQLADLQGRTARNHRAARQAVGQAVQHAPSPAVPTLLDFLGRGSAR